MIDASGMSLGYRPPLFINFIKIGLTNAVEVGKNFFTRRTAKAIGYALFFTAVGILEAILDR